VAACSSDRSIKVWDIRTHKLLQHYGSAHGSGEGSAGLVNSIAFGGQAGEWLISTGGDGLVKIWDLQEGHLFYTLYGHKTAPTTAACFSKDQFGGKYFASAGADAQVLVWKANFNLIDTAENSLAAALPGSNRITSKFRNTSPTVNSEELEPVSIAEEFHLKVNGEFLYPIYFVKIEFSLRIDRNITKRRRKQRQMQHHTMKE
jgi:WD40 repeat protein